MQGTGPVLFAGRTKSPANDSMMFNLNVASATCKIKGECPVEGLHQQPMHARILRFVTDSSSALACTLAL